MRGVFRDLAGRVFGYLTVLARCPGKGTVRWSCRCVCSGLVSVRSGHLTDGTTLSCGCMRNSLISARNTRHGEASSGQRPASLEYVTWRAIIARCEEATSISYRYYGARGISVCVRWRASFSAFLADVGRRPSPRHSLDRFPNRDGNYEPGNVRWATQKQQQRNKSSNHRVLFRGEELCLSELAERCGVLQGTIAQRLRLGWTIEEAVVPVTLRGVVYKRNTA